MGGNVSINNIQAEKINLENINRKELRTKINNIFYTLNNLHYFMFGKFLYKKEHLDSGFQYNGSSSFILNPEEKDEDILPYKKFMGDIDIITPLSSKKSVFKMLEMLKSKQNKDFVYIGSNRANIEKIGNQIITIFRIQCVTNDGEKIDINAQIDFEFLEVLDDLSPTAWSKLSHNSSIKDIKYGIKAVTHKHLLQSLVGAVSIKSNVIVVTPTANEDNFLKKIKKEKEIRMNKFSVSRGLRVAYEKMDFTHNNLEVYRELKTSESKYITDPTSIFSNIFKKGETEDLSSFIGLVKLIKMNFENNIYKMVIQRFQGILFGATSQVIEKDDYESDMKIKVTALKYLSNELGVSFNKEIIYEFYGIKHRVKESSIRKIINEVYKTETIKQKFLNISIVNFDKVISSLNFNNFLEKNVTIYEKYDGVKVSVFRKPNNGESLDDNFIISYKGNIIYDGEFNSIIEKEAEQETIGASQFKAVQDYFKENLDTFKKIPFMTEMFFEFIIKKPTLTRSYEKLHSLILIGVSEVKNFTDDNGIFDSKTKEMNLEVREQFKEQFGFKIPKILFKGSLKDNKFADIKDLKDYFLNIESEFGGKTEGVVIEFSNPYKIKNKEYKLLKIVQEDQYSKELRNSIKSKYKMEDEDENNYWDLIKKTSYNFIRSGDDLKINIIVASNEIYSRDFNIFHSKKSKLNIKDDIQLSMKLSTIRTHKGNNGGLVVLKGRIFTKGHQKLIQYAINQSDYLYVCYVSNKESKRTLQMRINMLKSVFPKLSVITHSSGNINSILNKINKNINTVFCGYDRCESFKNQLKRNEIDVDCIERNESSISATKIIQKINDYEYFEKNVPEQVLQFYSEIKTTYKQGEKFRQIVKSITEEG